MNGSYTDSRDLGYWSMTRALLGDKEDTLTYSVPLKTRDGKTYGILGVGITASHLKNTLPNAEIHESGKGGYCLAIRDGDSDNYRVVYSDENCVQNGEVLQLQPGANTYRISDEQEEVLCLAAQLSGFTTAIHRMNPSAGICLKWFPRRISWSFPTAFT